jgi:ribonuclease P protein component
MLARENRLISADDFRSTMRTGRKVPSNHLVTYLKKDPAPGPVRFGFVVAKSVGGAVSRNLVKRRLRAVARELLAEIPSTENISIVVRALEGAADATFENFSPRCKPESGNWPDELVPSDHLAGTKKRRNLVAEGLSQGNLAALRRCLPLLPKLFQLRTGAGSAAGLSFRVIASDLANPAL